MTIHHPIMFSFLRLRSQRSSTGNKQLDRRDATLDQFQQGERRGKDFHCRPAIRLACRVFWLRQPSLVMGIGSFEARLNRQSQPVALKSGCITLVAINP